MIIKKKRDKTVLRMLKHCRLYHKYGIGMKELCKILDNNQKTIAFVIGNGINYHFCNKKAISWLGLLEELWSQYCNDSNTDFSKIGGLPYTELYDIIELRYNKTKKEQEHEKLKRSISSLVNSVEEESKLEKQQFVGTFKSEETNNTCTTTFPLSDEIEQVKQIENRMSKDIAKELKTYGLQPITPNSYESKYAAMNIASGGVLGRLLFLKKHISGIFKDATLDSRALVFLNYARKKNIPILTTNYDHAMANLLKLQRYQFPLYETCQHLYPISTYFSGKSLNSATEGFGIWHINGMIDYQNSIRLGLCDYMDLVQFLRSIMQINKDYGIESLAALNDNMWIGKQTWLDILFKKSLFIMGLGLNEDEVPLRWLLLQRERYNSMYNKGLKGWYVTCKDDEVSSNKRMFLENVGFNIIQIDDYRELYEDLWRNII